MGLLQDVLDREDEELKGTDLLLFNLACQIDLHDGIPVDDKKLMYQVVTDFGSLLGEFEVDQFKA